MPIVLRVAAAAAVALLAAALAVLLGTALLGASLSDRAVDACQGDAVEGAIEWHWLPPAWDCTRTEKGGHRVTGRIRPWSSGTFTPAIHEPAHGPAHEPARGTARA